MAIGTPYHLGSAAPTSSVTTTTVTAGVASGSGDAIIVCTASTGTTGSVTGITDTKSNTYALVQRYAAGSYEVECWIAQGAAALTTSDTITATWSGSGTTHRMDVMGVSGVATFSAADPAGIATASSTGSTAPNTGATGTLAQSGELAIAVFAYGSGGGTITWGNSYTSMASVQAGSTEFLVTGWKSLSTTSGTTASGTITSAPWTALVVTFQPPASGGGPFIWYDGTYNGWTALQQTVADPPMFAYGPAWTTAQLATLPSNTIQMPLDDTGSHPHSTTVIDVESVDVTSASVIASWINSRNALAGGYAANRPTVYLNIHGSYYVGAGSDVITPLANTYGLNPGQDYDLWIADTTGSQPAAPVYTLGVPCVATQYANYNQTGHSYDISIAFDSTWTAAFGAQVSSAVIADAGAATVGLSVVQPSTTPVTPPPPGTPGAASPGYAQIVVQCGFAPAAPVAVPGSLILDDPVNGLLDTGTLADTTSWTDVTAYVRSGTISRPSTRTMGPLLTYQAATASVVLANGDGRFDPDNTGGPYYPNILPMIPVQISATWNGVTYPLFYGFTDSFQDDGVNYGGRYAEITMSCTDGFKVLQGITLPTLNNPAGTGEDTGARIRRVLNSADWYTGQRQIDTGAVDLQGTTYGSTPLTIIQDACEAELGEFWQDGSGSAVFRNRHAILTETRSNTIQVVFGDSPGTVHNYGNVSAWFMSAASYIHSMYLTDPADTAHFFDTSSAFAISTDPASTGIQDGFTCTPVLKYSSYAQFSSDITAGAITAGYTWVLYDGEDWSQTPQAEIDDPWTYMASFTTLAHAHSYKVMLTPARDLGNDPTSVHPKLTGETLDQWYIRTNIAGTAAGTGAEVVHIQDQANQQTLSEFESFWNTTRAQAIAANSSVQVSIGVSTTYGGAAGMTAALLSVTGYAGVWVNALDQGEAADFLSQINTSFTELPYTSASRACDDTIMANDVQATLDGTNYVEVKDSASIAQSLFPRTYQSSTLELLSASDLLDWAQFVLLVSKDSELRFDQLTLDPRRDPDDLWPQALGREIGDRIQVWRRPPGSVAVARECFVRGMQHDFDASAQTWATQFTLQDATRYSGFLILDSATEAILDSARIGF